MFKWPAKAAGSVLDYTWNPNLDAGDAISGVPTATVSTGDVVVDSVAVVDDLVVITLSGGTAGTECELDLSCETDDGRTITDTAAITIIDRADDDLRAFRLRYPAFASIPDESILYWLNDSDRVVDSSWTIDADVASYAYAAHMLIETGALAAQIPQGVKSFKSGSFSADLTEDAANREGYESTSYGREFLRIRRVNFGGPRQGWAQPANV